MAIKGDNIVDFKNYIKDVVEMLDIDNAIYEGKIIEEKVNGKITKFSVNLEKKH